MVKVTVLPQLQPSCEQFVCSHLACMSLKKKQLVFYKDLKWTVLSTLKSFAAKSSKSPHNSVLQGKEKEQIVVCTEIF